MGLSALRRYYRAKQEAAKLSGQGAVASAYAAKREELPGTPLPEEFPHRGKLLAAGIRTLEELREHTVASLQKLGLSKREAKEVLEAAEV